MSLFLFSLAGIPPLAGWYAKLVVFKAVIDAGTPRPSPSAWSPPSTRWSRSSITPGWRG